jgi:hypothetical protein
VRKKRGESKAMTHQFNEPTKNRSKEGFRKMKKRISGLLLITLAIFAIVLTGCSNNQKR